MSWLTIKYNINLQQWFTSAHCNYPYLPLKELLAYLATKTSGLQWKLILWLVKKITNWLSVWRNGDQLTIYLPNDRDYFIMHRYYCGLRFTESNPWLKLISNGRGKDETIQQLPGVLNLPLEGVVHVIKAQTSSLTDAQVWAIINQMGWKHCQRLKQ